MNQLKNNNNFVVSNILIFHHLKHLKQKHKTCQNTPTHTTKMIKKVNKFLRYQMKYTRIGSIKLQTKGFLYLRTWMP